VDTAGKNAKKIQEYIDPFTGELIKQNKKVSLSQDFVSK